MFRVSILKTNRPIGHAALSIYCSTLALGPISTFSIVGRRIAELLLRFFSLPDSLAPRTWPAGEQVTVNWMSLLPSQPYRLLSRSNAISSNYWKEVVWDFPKYLSILCEFTIIHLQPTDVMSKGKRIQNIFPHSFSKFCSN